MEDHNQNRKPQGPPQGPNRNRQSILAFLICLLVTLVCVSLVTDLFKDNSHEISYDSFMEMVDEGEIEKVVVQIGRAHV